MLKFAHDIAGGQGNLIATSLQSPNFNLANPPASPSPSWAVLKNGLAYFVGLVLSGGTITGPDYVINTSGIFIYSAAPALGNLIGSWAGAAGTDAKGNAYPQGFNITRGAIAGSTFSGTDFVINTSGAFFYSGTPAAGNLIASITPAAGADAFGNGYSAGVCAYNAINGTAQMFNGSLYVLNAAGSPNGTVSAGTTAGMFLTGSGATGGTSTLYLVGDTPGSVVVEGVLVASNPASPGAAEVWHVPGSMPTGWTGTIRYRLMPDATVLVHCQCFISTSAATGTITLFSGLSAAYTPAFAVRGPVGYFTNGPTTVAQLAGITNMRWSATTAGAIQMLAFPGGAAGTGITELDFVARYPLT